ncbi:MAG TPA: FAD-binding protein, partial [Hyphomicrobiaceae bacterium]|nr:FAD-binding protein [Hyphomicrobiaceae bacterium]
MTNAYVPSTEDELASLVSDARDRSVGLDIFGGGTKSAIGRPTNATARVSLNRITGITLYEPNEMVMSARAGTSLTEIRAALARGRQMMVFEPAELAGLVGGDPARATIGGVFATNASG